MPQVRILVIYSWDPCLFYCMLSIYQLYISGRFLYCSC